jgi:signal transduction histidine kinase
LTTRRLAVTILATAVIVTAPRVLAGGRPTTRLAIICLIYAAAMGAVTLVICPLVARWEAPGSAVAQRLVVAAALLGMAILGAVAASGVVIAAGLWPAADASALLASGLGTAVLVAVPLYVYETTRARRIRAERALREEAQRRDRAERLAVEARLASLESRVQPHFLFNTLNTIANTIVEDPLRAEQLVEQFARLLRASLRRTQQWTVPLRQELAAVWDYLEIEQARLEHRLRWRQDSMPELVGYEVPAFSLQSLVQNSIKHVAGVRPEGAEIRVEGHLVDGQLTLSVWDDGPGFALAEAPAGHGLDTLRAQLAALYGDQAWLEVHREGIGTRVAMRLPAWSAERRLR